MNKRFLIFIITLSCLALFLRKQSFTTEGPILKFDPSEDSAAESQPESQPKSAKEKKPDFVYGKTPIAKFGNDQTYFKLGGYGAFRFEHNSGQDLHDTFTFRRFVLTTDAKVASRFRIYSEIEFERFRKIEVEQSTGPLSGGLSTKQAIEATPNSEISIEQAWLQIDFKNWLRFQGGAVLIPLGRFNINHDDNVWNIARRSLIDRGVPVLPVQSAWDELGLGLNGDVELGEKSKLNYQIFVVNGAALTSSLENTITTRSGDTTLHETEGEFGIQNGTFSRDIKNGKTATGRLMYSPTLGHEFGFSGYWGRYTPSYLVDKNITAFGFDTLQIYKNFDFEAEYLFTRFGGLRSVLNSFASTVLNSESEAENKNKTPGVENEVSFNATGLASTKQGYWAELRYHIRPQWLTNSWFGKYFSDPQFIPIVRVEQAFLNNQVRVLQIQNGAITNLQTQNRRVDRFTAGLGFRLSPLLVFQLDYEYTQTNKGSSLAQVTNYLPTSSSRNQAVMFGIAFAF